jgi:hypothetical protein
VRVQFHPQIALLTTLRKRLPPRIEAAGLKSCYSYAAHALRLGEPVAFRIRKTARLAIGGSEAGHEVLVDDGQRDGSEELVARVFVGRRRRSIATANEQETRGQDKSACSHKGENVMVL